MKIIRVCFLGTPDFAAQHLNYILKNKKQQEIEYQIVGVVTQPDRPSGRKMQMTASAVKLLALQNNLTVLTPENLRKEPGNLEIIQSWKADIAVVVAFGQILSQQFLDSFALGAVNVHGSLLPLWRGAAPIQRSIEAGDTVSGVSLQKIVRKLDAGAIIGERRIELDQQITSTELYDRLSILGCELLTDELVKYIQGKLIPKEQDENLVTVAKKIEKEESLLQWSLPAVVLHNKVRAFTMGPGTYVTFQGKRLKIHKTKVHSKSGMINHLEGAIQLISEEQLVIQCAEGSELELLIVQPESKPQMNIKDFLKSQSLNLKFKKGDLFV